jgi:hypothetical protein
MCATDQRQSATGSSGEPGVEKGSGRFVITSVEPLPGKFMVEVPAGSLSEQTLLFILSEHQQGGNHG